MYMFLFWHVDGIGRQWLNIRRFQKGACLTSYDTFKMVLKKRSLTFTCELFTFHFHETSFS